MLFRGWLDSWIYAVATPGDEVLLREQKKPQAGLATAVIWMLLAGVFAAVFHAIRFLFTGYVFNTTGFLEQFLLAAGVPSVLLPQASGQTPGGVDTTLWISLLVGIIAVPVVFLAISLIFWAAARSLGGVGSFGEQSYLTATFAAPLTVIASALYIIPVLGGCLVALIGLYAVVLTFFAIKVAHDLEPGRAILALFIPLALVSLFSCVALSVLASSLTTL